jgi:hypothetical protein
MTSRDRLRGTEELDIFIRTLADFLKKHDGLRKWNEVRHREIVEQRFQENDETKELFEKLISNSPALANFLGFGKKIRVPQKGSTTVDEFKGKRFPTYLKIEGNGNGSDVIKKCPQNSYCRVNLETDAENDYFIRAYDPGKLILRPDYLIKSTNLFNGRLEIQAFPDKEYPIGTQLEIKVMLTSPEALEGYFKVNFKIEIVPPVEKGTKKRNKKTKPKGTFLALPEMVEVYKKDWENPIYDISSQDDLVTIMRNEDKTTSLINMDNQYFKSYIYQHSKNKNVLSNLYKISSTILGLSIDEQVENGHISAEQKRDVTNSLGKILLPMIDSLGEMKSDL